MSMLGMAMKAGKVQSGEFCAGKAIKSKKASLVILASDASANTGKKFTDMCEFRGIPVRRCRDKDSLGRAVGKGPRTVIAVTDSGLAGAIVKLIDA